MKTTREVVTAYMEAMARGDFPGAFAMFAEDGKYTIIGQSPISRTFNSREEINTELCDLLANRFKTTPQIFIEDYIIDGDRGVSLAHGIAEAKHGTYKQDHYAFYFRVRDGEVVEKIEFLDPSQLDIAVFGRRWADAPAPAA